MHFETSVLNIRLALVQCRTVLANWDELSSIVGRYHECTLKPIESDCAHIEGVVVCTTFGLCSNVFNKMRNVDLSYMFECFPKYSGNINYPVNSSSYLYDRESNKFRNSCRKELLEHCIELMETFVKEQSNVN